MEKLNELAELAQAMMDAETRKEAFSIGEKFTLAASPDAILAIAEAFRALERGQCGEALLEREEHHVGVVTELLKRISELEQRADAAEANAEHGRIQIEGLIAALDNEQLLCKRAEAKVAEEKRRADQNARYLETLTERMLEAEAKLADLEKQEPFAWHNGDITEDYLSNLSSTKTGSNIMPLYTAPPAPVLKPIELPPIIRIGYTPDEIKVMCNVRNDDIAAILAAGYEVKQ